MDLQAWITLLRWPVEIAALIFSLLPGLILLQQWNTLPDEIPAHFGITGRPDRWGGKWQAWILPVVSLVIYGAMSAVGGTWHWLLGREQTQPAEAVAILLWIKLADGALFAYLLRMTVRIARGQAERLNILILLGTIAIIAAPPFLIAYSHVH